MDSLCDATIGLMDLKHIRKKQQRHISSEFGVWFVRVGGSHLDDICIRIYSQSLPDFEACLIYLFGNDYF